MTNTKMISSEIYRGVYDSLIKGKKLSLCRHFIEKLAEIVIWAPVLHQI